MYLRFVDLVLAFLKARAQLIMNSSVRDMPFPCNALNALASVPPNTHDNAEPHPALAVYVLTTPVAFSANVGAGAPVSEQTGARGVTVLLTADG